MGFIKAFTGTERRNMKQSVDAIKALGGLAKAKLSGDMRAVWKQQKQI